MDDWIRVEPEVFEYFLGMTSDDGEASALTQRTEERYAVMPRAGLAPRLHALRLAVQIAGEYDVVPQAFTLAHAALPKADYDLFYMTSVSRLADDEAALVLTPANNRVAERRLTLETALGNGSLVFRGAQLHHATAREVGAPSVTWGADGPVAPSTPNEIGRYLLSVDPIGEGGLGQVFRAVDREVGRPVALKLARRRCLTRAQRDLAIDELRTAAQATHPAVVPIFDYGWYEDRLWFAMPLLEGRTLAARIARGPMTRREFGPLFEALSGAVHELHRRGVYHQDLKPDNVMLVRLRPDGDETPIVIDFGMARGRTQRVRGGTPYWMAPETAAALLHHINAIQVHGGPDRTVAGHGELPAVLGTRENRNDVFALAMIAREALEPQLMPEWTASPDVALQLTQSARTRHQPFRNRSLRNDVWPALEPVLHGSADLSAGDLASLVAQGLAKDTRRSQRRTTSLAVFSAFLVLSICAAVPAAFAYSALTERARIAEEQTESARIASLRTQQRVAALEAQTNRLVDSAARQRTRALALENQLYETESEIATMEDLHDLDSEAAGRLRRLLRGQRDALRDTQDQLEAALRARSGALSALTVATGQLETTRQALSAEREGHGADVERLSAEIDALERQVNAYAEDLSSVRTAATQCDQRLRDQAENLVRLQAEIDTARAPQTAEVLTHE